MENIKQTKAELLKQNEEKLMQDFKIEEIDKRYEMDAPISHPSPTPATGPYDPYYTPGLSTTW